jgi:threonine aldolase
VAYGDDPLTAESEQRFSDLFGKSVPVLFTWGGTGANIVGLQTMLSPFDAVICPATAHINVDECGAPERFTGCKLIDIPTLDGKLRPDQVLDHLGALGEVHHAQPKVISITQTTELGTCYQPDEVAALAELAHRHAMFLHLDGARIANAAATLGGNLRSFTVDAGVDVVTFGGTKNGMVYGEAVCFLRPDLARSAGFIRKQAGQLPSKMRFVAAQFLALFEDDLWLRSAGHANAMAQRLAYGVSNISGVQVNQPVEANGVFASLPRPAIDLLLDWATFYVWDASRHEVRWMCAFDTTPDDVDRFVAGVRAAITQTATTAGLNP